MDSNGDSDESIDLPLVNDFQNRFPAGVTPERHQRGMSAVTPCGHSVWTLFYHFENPLANHYQGTTRMPKSTACTVSFPLPVLTAATPGDVPCALITAKHLPRRLHSDVAPSKHLTLYPDSSELYDRTARPPSRSMISTSTRPTRRSTRIDEES